VVDAAPTPRPTGQHQSAATALRNSCTRNRHC
jgi:hypothetical protein